MAKLDIQSRTEIEVKLKITANKADLEPILDGVFTALRPRVKAAGFRLGKAPNNLVEQELGSQAIQGQLIESAANRFYVKGLGEHDLTPVAPPHVEVVKFVPYTELELLMTIQIMPPVKLPDYKKIKHRLDKAEVKTAEIEAVLDGLRDRAAKRVAVERKAAKGDEVIIDFEGTLAGRPVPGAKGQDYALRLGSGRFVPGFDEALVGAIATQEFDFNVTFPKDYAEKSLRGQKVNFKAKVKRVNQLSLPAIDDEFAVSIGPFKDIATLRGDIKAQITEEKKRTQLDKAKTKIVEQIMAKSQVSLPPKLVEAELSRLKSESSNEAEIQIEAERRVKTALVLSAIAKQEGLAVSEAELNAQMEMLAKHYQDKQMQQKLAEPSARREISHRLLIEKTLTKLLEYSTQ